MQDGKYVRTLAAVTMFALVGDASSVPINLNDFLADPTVVVSGDGSSAAFSEDPVFAAVLLSNDPGLGDPIVIVPGPGVSLAFDYVFNVGAGESDEFGALLIDAATGSSAGLGYEFFAQVSGSGLVEINISALVGSTLGLRFQLTKLSGDSASTSTANVWDVRLVTQEAPVPAPVFLLAAGLLGLIQIRRTNRGP